MELLIPHQVGLVVAFRAVAVAGPDTERHRGADTTVTAMDLRLSVPVANVDMVDLPRRRKPGQHAMHRHAGLAVEPGSTVEAARQTGDDEDAQQTLLEREALIAGREFVHSGSFRDMRQSSCRVLA